jgi:RNA polymerase sigma-70 factor (ECF subfamily)
MNTNRVLTWEQHLALRASQGDRVAFDLLMDLNRPMLSALAMRLLRNTDDAYDAVQDTMIKAFRAMTDFDPSRPLKPWLARICTNCCIDTVRQRKKNGEPIDQYEAVLADERSCVNEDATLAIHADQVEDAIRRLPEHYRTIVMLRHYRHMEVNEIAAHLDKPEGTVKSWLFRARALLRKDLAPAMG